MINKKPPLVYTALFFVILLFFSSIGKAQTTYISHFTTQDGLPSNNCFYTLQDSKGYIWVGTDAGVSRFDGRRFENFSIDDGLSDSQIIQLKEDKSGKIWFLTLNGQLSYFFNGRIFNENNDKLLKILKFNAIIVSFFEDSQGRMWFGTNKNILFMWDGKRLNKYIPKNSAAQLNNVFVHEDQQGRIWAFNAFCAQVYDGSTFKVATNVPLPISYKTMVNLPNRKLLYLAKNGLVLKTGWEQKLLFKINPALLNSDPGYFYASRDELWLSNSNGIFKFDTAGKSTNYLPKVAASQVVKDNKNNMWFTTGNGIYMLPNIKNRLYTIDQDFGLKCNAVKSILKDKNGRFWLGLDNGTINIIGKNKTIESKIELPDKKKYNRIKQLSIDSLHESVYFASDYGLGRISGIYSGRREISYLKEVNNSSFAIKNFSINDSSGLSIALSSGVIILKDRINSFKFSSSNLKKWQGFLDNRAYDVYYDRYKNLWFSNINGLAKFSENKLITFYKKNELLTKRINDIQELQDGTLVLATDGYGLVFIKGNKLVKRLTQTQGLANNVCKKLFIRDNVIWVITNNGINRIHKNKNELIIEAFEYTNPLLKNEANDLYIDKDTAYFATNKGLVYFYNKPAEQLMEPPNVHISSILVNHTILALNDPKIMLDPSSNTITFRYNAIDFQNQEMSFRYRLKSDAGWTETKNRRIEFSSLAPGEYRFELSAKTNNSKWSKPTSVAFVLKAPFWQSFWFLALLFLLAALTFYKIAVVVTKRQKNKEQEQLLLKNKILMLEQQALQAMMNPHFVFNVMNSIQHYINTKDTSSANKVLTGFARLIRKNLEICTKSFITLAEEIEYLELYLSLEKKRFGEKFKYNFNIDNDIDKEDTLIPSMLLQPYIENAIWHGIMPKEEGGQINIRIRFSQNDYLLIEIIDDGIGISNSLKSKIAGHESKGMSLTRERINLLNQIEANPIQIEVFQNGNSGTTVSIKVPY